MKKVNLHVHSASTSWNLPVHPTSANRAIQEFKAQGLRAVRLDVERPDFVGDKTTQIYHFNPRLIVAMFIEPDMPF